MIKNSDAIILFGRDALIDKLESMAISYNLKVYKFTFVLGDFTSKTVMTF